MNSVLSLLVLGAKEDSATEIELRDILGKVVVPDLLKNLNREILADLQSIGKKLNLSNDKEFKN